MSDRLPPHAVEVEKAALGCFLTETETLEHWLERAPGPEVFFDLRHQEIFGVIRALYEDKGTFDLVSVRQKLADHGALERCGDMAALLEMQEAAVSPLRIPEYTDILLDKWKRRQLLHLAGQCSEWAYAPGENIESTLAQAEESVLALHRKVMDTEERRLRDDLPEVIDEIENDFRRGKPMMKGLPTGLRYLDNMLCGLMDGELIILAARPSCGKTTLAFQIAEHIAIDQKLPVGVFSLEMRNKSLVQRCLFARATCDLQKARNGFIQKRDIARLIEASKELAEANIWISPPRRMTVEQLCARARRMKREHDLRLIVIDYFQLLDSERAKHGRTEELEEVSKALKQLAVDLDLPVLLLAQMNRDYEKRERNRPPQMSDLKGCGGLEQDADVIGFLYDQVIKEDTNPDNPQLGFLQRLQEFGVPAEWCLIDEAASWRNNIRRINLLIEKQRNGPTGNVDLAFIKPWLRFAEFNQFQGKFGE